MYELQKTFHFEAGHFLKSYEGKCASPHGHSYSCIVHLQGKTLDTSGPKTNMITDFNDIVAVVRPMIEKYFDHKWLNETLENDSVTVEFMAKWIYDFLKPHLVHLKAITVQETATSKVIYSPES